MDVSEFDTPTTDDLGWDFYDTFLNCRVTKMGITSGKTSTADEDLTEKYLKTVVKKQLEEATPIMKPKEIPPEPFRSLLTLQSSNGRWENLKFVMKLLHLPSQAKLACTDIEWEQATAFVLVAMRQEYKLFHILGDSYDKGKCVLYVCCSGGNNSNLEQYKYIIEYILTPLPLPLQVWNG